MSPMSPGSRPSRTSINPIVAMLACCGGCGLLFVLLMGAGLLVGMKAFLAPKIPPPVGYIGTWQGEDNTLISIAKDGVAGYRFRHDQQGAHTSGSVSGGRITVNEATSQLTIGVLRLKKSWHIDSPPHTSGNTMVMKLSGVAFRRTSPEADGKVPKAASDLEHTSPE